LLSSSANGPDQPGCAPVAVAMSLLLTSAQPGPPNHAQILGRLSQTHLVALDLHDVL
jgi:hypothetical protein